jgi:hypothetical protein
MTAWGGFLLLAILVSGGCTDTCPHANDGECDDGRPGSVTGVCPRGTDCTDCGPT